MRVGLIGTGGMGASIARRLLAVGHEVTAFNRTPASAAPLVAAGAVLAGTPAAAARGCAALITVVTDAQALRDVLDGPDGAAQALEPGTLLIDVSTAGVEAAHEMRALVAPGVAVLDAPVLGSRAEAAAGALHLLVGGDAADVVRSRPLLDALGTVTHVGPAGAGAAAKLVANLALLGTLAVLAEVSALAAGLGLDDGAGAAVLAATPLAEQAARRAQALRGHTGPTRFALALARKDATLAAHAATRAGLAVPVTHAVGRRLAAAEAAGLGGEDFTAMLTPACWRT